MTRFYENHLASHKYITTKVTVLYYVFSKPCMHIDFSGILCTPGPCNFCI